MKRSNRMLFVLTAFAALLYATPSYGLLSNEAAPPEESASAESEQDWTDSSSRTPGTRNELSIEGVSCGFCWCPAGSFTMGSPKSEKNRVFLEFPHKVTLSAGFWIMETETTQRLWEAVMGNNPSAFQEPDRPVECVSWDDCRTFVAKLNDSKIAPEGWKFSLPTEAQWEYACRAGTTTPFSFGSSLTSQQANFDGNYPYGGGAKDRNLKQTAPVKSYSPNAWGLYDMHGNVWEWQQDWFGDYSKESAVDPTGPQKGSFRVIRGGCWNYKAEDCRSANRSFLAPTSGLNGLGFRLVLVRR